MKHDQHGSRMVAPAERARWVARYRASGMGLKRFATEHGLSPGQLHYWVYAAATGPATEAEAPVFQEVRLAGSLTPLNGWAAEVALASGVTVRLRQGAALEWAVALVQALGGPCSR